MALLVSTMTTERAFSVMKVIKIRLCNKINDEFLTNNLTVYIKRKIYIHSKIIVYKEEKKKKIILSAHFIVLVPPKLI